ncbi:hypothetical protein Tco_0284884 [Tanacetum coccineum]
MVEPEKPLKKKDQIMFDKEDNVQAMMDAEYELAARLQAEEQGELTIEEKSRLFVELMNKRKKHFTRLRAEEQRRKPPTKAQNRNTMSTYLKNMVRYKHNQLKTKCFEDIHMLFDKEMKIVNIFVGMDTELVTGSKTRTEGSFKRAREELESKNLKKQKLDENVKAEVDDNKKEAEMKKHMEIVPDDEVAIDAIPLTTKPPIIMLQNIDREDLETFWKLVKAKHRTQSDSLKAIFFKWSTFCEISEFAYLYADLFYWDQHALDNSLVAPEKRLKIERCNARIAFTKPQKEETYKVTLDALKLSLCYPAFQITAEVPEIYMHQFWNTIKKIGKMNAYDFKLEKKKCRVDTEVFREILQICPRLPNQDFAELPSEDDLLSFIKELVILATVKCFLPFILIKCTSLGGHLLLSLRDVSLGNQQDFIGSGNHVLKSYGPYGRNIKKKGSKNKAKTTKSVLGMEKRWKRQK